MKKIIILTSLMILSKILFSQDTTEVFKKSELNNNIYEYFGSRLTYPLEMAMKGVQGFTVVSFHLNERGILDSLEFLSYPDIQVAQEVAKVLMTTKNMWTPTLKNGTAIPFKYKLAIRYLIYSGTPPSKEESYVLKEESEKKFKKKKYEEALELVNKAININPYDSEYYKLRSKIYRSIDDIEKSDADNLASIKMNNEIIAVLYVISYETVKRTEIH